MNNNLVEHGDDGSKLTIILIVKIVKFATRFFSNIENHIMEGSVPDSVPNFTPRDSNPKLLQAATIMSVVSNNDRSALAGIYGYQQKCRTRFESRLHCLGNT